MPAADHSDIAGRVFQDLSQDLMIVQVAAGHNDHKGIGTDTDMVQYPVKRPDHNIIRFRKTAGVGKFRLGRQRPSPETRPFWPRGKGPKRHDRPRR